MNKSISNYIDQYNMHMSMSGKTCFCETARRRFKEIYMLENNVIPELFTLRNKNAVFFYNIIMEKYYSIIKKYKDTKISYYYIYQNIDNEIVKEIFKEMLDFYNTVVLCLLNTINPTNYTKCIFNPL